MCGLGAGECVRVHYRTGERYRALKSRQRVFEEVNVHGRSLSKQSR
jgi:hypothetical protein